MQTTQAMLNRADRRRAQTRAALVDAARRLFAERGVEATTIQQIADTADVAKGSFYNHFTSREQILESVAAETLEELGAALDREVGAREQDPARVIALSLAATLRTCTEDPTLGGFVLATDVSFAAADAALGGRGRRDLERGCASGRFRLDGAEHVEVVATAIHGASQALLRRRLSGEAGPSADRRLIESVLRMLGVDSREAHSIAEEIPIAHTGSAPGDKR